MQTTGYLSGAKGDSEEDTWRVKDKLNRVVDIAPLVTVSQAADAISVLGDEVAPAKCVASDATDHVIDSGD